jgi:hypothetical protein
MQIMTMESSMPALNRNRLSLLLNSENLVNQRHGLPVQRYDVRLASEAITVRGPRPKVGGRRFTDNDGLMVHRDETTLA